MQVDPAPHPPRRFEIPVRYEQDALAGLLLFTGDYARVAALLPGRAGLYPMGVPGRRALVGLGCFHYLRSSLGEYGEVVLLVPCLRFGRTASEWVRGSTVERGQFVPQMCVTGTNAREAGALWGYPKLMTDMSFQHAERESVCRVEQAGEHVLTLRMPKAGKVRPFGGQVCDYTVKGGRLLRTRIEMTSAMRVQLRPRGTALELGTHAFSEVLRALELSPRPLTAVEFVGRRCVLPLGEAVVEGVVGKPYLDGGDRPGELQVSGAIKACPAPAL